MSNKKEKNTIITRYAVLIGNAIQAEPTNMQEAQLAAQGKLGKQNGWVGKNYDKADAFVIIVKELDKAKLFTTIEEAEAFSTFLAHTPYDARLEGNDINVFEITTTINNEPLKAFRNKYIRKNASKVDKQEALKKEMAKDKEAIKKAKEKN